jgi:hypothetical protein
MKQVIPRMISLSLFLIYPIFVPCNGNFTNRPLLYNHMTSCCYKLNQSVILNRGEESRTLKSDMIQIKMGATLDATPTM